MVILHLWCLIIVRMTTACTLYIAALAIIIITRMVEYNQGRAIGNMMRRMMK